MARGGARLGAGRKKGATEKKTREIAEAAVEKGLTPLEYMLETLRDETADPGTRRWAAEKAAPYIHPRLNSVEHSGTGGGPIKIVAQSEDVGSL